MALSLSKIEAVDFGGKAFTPQIDRTQMLRLRELKVNDDNLEEAREVLADCFGVHKAEVKEFLEKNPFVLDYSRLQVYLTQGQSGLDNFEKRMDAFMEEQMKKAAEEAGETNE